MTTPTTHGQSRTRDIGIDADGVMYPMWENLRLHASKVTGRPVRSFPDPAVWDLSQAWDLTPAQVLELLHDGVDNGVLLLEGKPYPGVVGGLCRLKAAGHRIHVVTDREGLGHTPGLAQQRTRDWLQRWNVPYDTLTFTRDKTSVHTDVFIDDRPENYLALVEAGVDTYLRSHPYNAHISAPVGRRVPTFTTFTARVLAAA